MNEYEKRMKEIDQRFQTQLYALVTIIKTGLMISIVVDFLLGMRLIAIACCIYSIAIEINQRKHLKKQLRRFAKLI